MPRLMGILNVTPDSFSDGGVNSEVSTAIARAEQLVSEGAEFIDVGGESSRPGAAPVAIEEELQRTIPVLEALRGWLAAPISIDTTKASVAKAAIQAGVEIVNDISGLTFDPKMPALCAETGVGVICMHMQGTPQTMQQNPRYDDVVVEIAEYLTGRVTALVEAGIAREAIVVDPGIGFGKTAAHNLAILSRIGEIRSATGRPVLVGHSRKRFLEKVLGKKLEERTFGTVGVSLGLAARGVDILRLHDIAPTRDCLAAYQAVMQGAAYLRD